MFVHTEVQGPGGDIQHPFQKPVLALKGSGIRQRNFQRDHSCVIERDFCGGGRQDMQFHESAAQTAMSVKKLVHPLFTDVPVRKTSAADTGTAASIRQMFSVGNVNDRSFRCVQTEAEKAHRLPLQIQRDVITVSGLIFCDLPEGVRCAVPGRDRHFPALTAIHQDPGIVRAETIGKELWEQGIVHTGESKGGIFFCAVQNTFLCDQHVGSGQFQQLWNRPERHLPAIGTGKNGCGLPLGIVIVSTVFPVIFQPGIVCKNIAQLPADFGAESGGVTVALPGAPGIIRCHDPDAIFCGNGGTQEGSTGTVGQKRFAEIMDLHGDEVFSGTEQFGCIVIGISPVTGHVRNLRNGTADAVDPDAVCRVSGDLKFRRTDTAPKECFPEIPV